MSRRVVILLLAAAFSSPTVASADWIVSPYVGLRFSSQTTFFVASLETERDKFTFGGSVGFLTDGVLGAEADIAVVPEFFESPLINRSGHVVTLMGNVVLAVPLAVTEYGLRPYVVGGAGLLNARFGSAALDLDNTSLFGMNLGGGAIGPLTPRSSVRFDVRYFRNLSHAEGVRDLQGNPANLNFWRATVGLTFRF